MEIAFVGIAVVIALEDVFGIERMVLVQADLGANTITNLLERTGHGALGIDIRTERARELVLQHQTIAPDVLAFAVIGLVLHLAAVHIGAAHGDLGAVGVLPTLAKRDVEAPDAQRTDERGVEAVARAPVFGQLIVSMAHSREILLSCG